MNRHRIALAGFAIFVIVWCLVAFVQHAIAATFGGN